MRTFTQTTFFCGQVEWRPLFRRSNRLRVSPYRLLLYDLQGGRCFYCCNPTPLPQFTVDHVVPVSKGGADEFANKVGACEDCNGRKGNATVDPEWVAKRIETFNTGGLLTEDER